MKTIIAGSRNITDLALVYRAVDLSNYEISEVVSGLARGVDTLALEFASAEDIPVKGFPALWDKFGRSAGPLRNREMGDYADCLIAIWDGKSSGTRHMINYMKSLGKPTFVFIPDQPSIW
jgi:hypothetical protein